MVEVNGGYVKPANFKDSRPDRCLSRNQNGKRRCVVVIHQHDGHTLLNAFASESAALTFIWDHVARSTEIMTDESSSLNALHARHVVKRINHQVAYSMGGACTIGVESFFSRTRRPEQGHHHYLSGVYLARYGQKSARREDHHRDDNGRHVWTVTWLALRLGRRESPGSGSGPAAGAARVAQLYGPWRA